MGTTCFGEPVKNVRFALAGFVLLPLTAAVGQVSAATISNLYASGNGTYDDIYNAEVTGVLSVYSTGAETFVVSDSTASVVFYDNLLTFSNGSRYSPAVGDEYSTITTLTNTDYQNSPEVTGFYFTGFSTGNPVTIPVLTAAQVKAAGNGSSGVPPYSESIVTLDNVTLPSGTTSLLGQTSYAITDSSGTTTLYTDTTDSAVAAAVSAANTAETASGGSLFSGPIDITGYVNPYFGVSELYPLSISSAVPELTSISLLLCGAIPLLRRHRA
jgi:hypothetical protein